MAIVRTKRSPKPKRRAVAAAEPPRAKPPAARPARSRPAVAQPDVDEPDRSSPQLAEVDADALEFIAAIDRFKKEHGRPFPSWSEVLLVLRQLGYRRD
jgi:hypothetical protein